MTVDTERTPELADIVDEARKLRDWFAEHENEDDADYSLNQEGSLQYLRALCVLADEVERRREKSYEASEAAMNNDVKRARELAEIYEAGEDHDEIPIMLRALADEVERLQEVSEK